MTYQMGFDAIGDLDKIIAYTLEKWGEDAVEKYVGELEEKLEAIGKGEVVVEKAFNLSPDLYITRFRHHLIYYLVEERKKPLIIRILHHKQDRVRHLDEAIMNLNWAKISF